VANDQDPGAGTHAKKDEAVLGNRVVFVIKLNGELIMKDCLGLLKGDPMLL